MAKPSIALPFKGIPSIACTSLKFLFELQFLMSGTRRKKIAFGRLHKDLFSPLSELSKRGEGEVFSTVKAWDVFHMLEQLKKDFVFKLGMYEALDEDQGLRQL